ncbi:MAG: hypothetical protein H0V74_04395, partial [Chloroflexi bacterium]|nr:hypothetical protein [Chloroflexota bacterium]
KRFARENGLTLVMTLLFVLALAGQTVSGFAQYNEEQTEHDEPVVSLPEYVTTGHFGEAVFENWESEFLQMGLFVILTVGLRQRGSPESKPIGGRESVDREPDPKRRGAPWPVRAGGVVARIYEHSLGLALLTLFAISFALHVLTGAAETSAEQAAHGGSPVSAIEYLATRRLWFESFQNWQSEFMSVGALVVLSIFLREKGSPESKPVDTPHSQTGT